MNVTIVGGAGRLGLPLAAVIGQAGHNVFIADINQKAVIAIMDNTYESPEPGVTETISQLVHTKKLIATTDTSIAAYTSDLILVIVPTPSNEDGSFSSQHVWEACIDIARGMDPDKKTLVMISSTVMPGETNGYIRKSLEVTGLKEGQDFHLVYSPEFVRQGSIVSDFMNPETILIGGNSDTALFTANKFFNSITKSKPEVHMMDIRGAEIAKIGLNAMVVGRMAMANQIAWIAHRSPGTDANLILDAIGSDSRIGHRYMSPGPPDGGPCFPRDSRALAIAASQLGISHQVLTASDEWRESQITLIADEAISYSHNIGILGLTFKVGVEIVEESPGIKLANELAGRHCTVRCQDPHVQMPEGNLTLQLVIDKSDVIIIVMPHPEYSSLEAMNIDDKVIIDMWGRFPDLAHFCKEYIHFGHKDSIRQPGIASDQQGETGTSSQPQPGSGQ
jgi:UDPglucose 6-dehydrogenase